MPYMKQLALFNEVTEQYCNFKQGEGLQDVSAQGPFSTAYHLHLCKQLTKAVELKHPATPPPV